MASRADFFLYVFCDVVVQAMGIAFFAVVFARIPALGGWSLPQALLLYGFSELGYGLFGLSFSGMQGLFDLLRSGRFDELLLRPVDPMAQCFARGLNDCGGLVTGALLMGASWAQGAPLPSVGGALLFLPALACIACLHALLHALIAGASFFLAGASGPLLALLSALRPYARYPASIFPRAVQLAFTLGVPLLFMGYYPAALLQGRPEGWPALLLPGVLLALYALVRLVWRAGLRRYQGAGN